MSVYSELMNETQQRPGRRQKGTSRPFGSRGPRAGKLSPEDQAAFDKVFPPPKKKAPPTDVAHTEYEGPSLKEKLARLKEEDYTPTTRPEQSRVRKQISKSVKSSGWFKKKSAVSGQTKLARVRSHEDPTSLSKPHTRAVSHATSKKGTLTVAHTEYEGTSLREKLEYLKRSMGP